MIPNLVREFFSRRQLLWKLLWIACVVIIAMALLGSIYFEAERLPPGERSDLQELSVELVANIDWLLGDRAGAAIAILGELAQNDGIFGLTIGSLFAGLTLATIYIFKVPNIRSHAVQGLAWGYYENYLSGVVEKIATDTPNFRIIIILPSYELVERPRFYWARLQTVLEREGFTLDNVRTDAVFGRDVFSIQRLDSPPLPIFVDLPSTLKVLRRILELEAHTPAGRTARHRWWRRRFKEIRADFRDTLIDFFGDEKWGNIVFVDGDNTEKFSQEIRREISALENEVRALERSDDDPDA